ncbi:Arm DNA-binding domain-containing protein [Novosphingobium sp. MD-1]|uniref:Arm DNA-binding domain-containing protein n=1 Tax=Novosphingobium sp. MD-1 TaxID=1630648 RepID=UPI0035D009A3
MPERSVRTFRVAFPFDQIWTILAGFGQSLGHDVCHRFMRLACDEGTVGKAQTLSPAIINALASGKKNWVFRRRIAHSTTIAQLKIGTFPAFTIAAARDWARTQSAGPQLSSDPAARDAMSRRTAYVDAW